jgi:hypothetical protein
MYSLRIFTCFSIIVFLAACGNNVQSENEQLSDKPLEESTITEKELIALGDSISMAAFKRLSSKLKEKIDEGGPENAIEFCQVNALDLTNEPMEGVSVKRAAVLFRNYKNEADSLDMAVIDEYNKQMQTAGVELKPITFFGNTQAHYYKPILTMPLCLNCHGSPSEDIAIGTLQKINDLYPNDKAIGFTAGSLRGVWRVSVDI